MNVILLGPISSGKGTQASFIENNFNVISISIGELLRKRREIKDEIGLKIASMQQQGLLVDDDITLQVLEEKIKTCDMNQGILFDGYPRTIYQVTLLDNLLKKYDRQINIVINLEIDDKAIIDRIGGRLLCSKCGEIYHITQRKPVKEGICDKCGSDLYKRDDDTEEGIKKRLDVYHNYVVPVIKEYTQRGLVTNVNALQDIEKVSADIKRILGGVSSDC